MTMSLSSLQNQVAISKSGSFKGTPQVKVYQSYKSFNIDSFKCILNQKLNNLSSTSNDDFGEIFLRLLNKHASLKKILWHNNVLFMTKVLQKEIMKRSKFKIKYNKKRNHENKEVTVYHCWGKPKKLTLKNWTLKKLVTIKHFGKLSGHISVIKTNLLKLPLLKAILL